MKKRILFFVTFFIVALSAIYAYGDGSQTYSFGTVFLQPMGNTGGIPMQPVRDSVNNDNPYDVISSAPVPHDQPAGIEGVLFNDLWIEIDRPDNPDTEDIDESTFTVVNSGRYSNLEMIAVGGVWDMPIKDVTKQEQLSIQVDAFCDNGFYFVSQSNPSYKRPFVLYLIPKAIPYKYKWMEDWYVLWTDYYYAWTRKPQSRMGKVRTLGESGNSISFSYANLVPSDEMLRMRKKGDNGGSVDDKFNSAVGYDSPRLWFDLVLGLPGIVRNDILVMPDGREFPLVEANDYSAIVTLTLQATCGSEVSAPLTLTIPFSGSYKSIPDGEFGSRLEQDTVSMYVHPSAAAGNLNLRNYGRQQIASLEIMATKTFARGAGRRASNNPTYAIFLSSSSSPTDSEAEKFKLVKENLGYDVTITPYNSVGYKVVLIDNQTFGEKIYDGTDYIDSSISLDLDNIGFREDSGIAITNQKYNFVTLPHPSDYDFSHSKDVKSFNFSGTAYIEIEDNSSYLMESGRYTSSVYVHVMPI